ncbi:hypothetical protein [Cellvibrio fibrivorans]|uniref:DNA-binding MarR family transcriptional regulator n=1 Tax=Cellvibrio fibrivorans TaxID=126350 RepID=A0ABU1V0R2_9GAMM|nr:hypothetical protein [Cellvibrio fibrivorans]MDR7091024.1 DNA-binding MarR family transcriptional regulator [Cellvibrio fibrivorans]
MTDIIQDVRDYFADRFSSPLWISIIVSWLFINWQLPIAALFETEKFSVAYILEYKSQTTHWCLITIPVILGLAYSILSSSAKETLELLSKTIRNIIAKADRNGRFYKSMSITEHENQISRLKRQLQKIEGEKEQLNELSLENTRLLEEISLLKTKQAEAEEKLLSINELTEKNKTLEKENKKFTRVKINDTVKQKVAPRKISYGTDLVDIINEVENQNTKMVLPNNNIDTSSYYEKIINSCSDSTIESLKDPSSRASLLMALELIDNAGSYSIEEIAKNSGFPQKNLYKSINTAQEAGLVGRSSHKPLSITETGKRKLTELRSDESLADIAQALSKINSFTKQEILSLLKNKSINFNAIKEKVNFNKSLLILLDELVNDKKIHKEGSIYFFGEKTAP